MSVTTIMRMVLENNDNIHVSTCLLYNKVLNNFYTNDGDQLEVCV